MSEQEFIEAFSDKKFVNELLRLKTGEQVRKVLKKKGICLTAEELDKFAEVLVKALEKNKTEEEEIGNCSGGASGGGNINDVVNNKKEENAVVGAEILAGFLESDSIKDGSFLGSYR